jgi:DHA1 family bicyclomycin/chloramphenicol resistance-like MFS transporter
VIPPASRAWHLPALLAALAMLGPFSIDTYLPAFPQIGATLGASMVQVQQSLTVYLLAYAAMMLWQGAISDALGRRPVILAHLAVYALACLGCAIAGNIESLLLFRVLQGMSAGAGIVIGRAIIRDRYHGPEAQRLMSRVTMLFAVAPAVAPVLGGWLLVFSGWRAIFYALLFITLALLAWCWRDLPETLAPTHRQSLHPRALFFNYLRVGQSARFLLLSGIVACNFAGFFLYIPAAPVFLIQHLGVSSSGFAWLFLPSISGIVAGAVISGRVAGRLTPRRTIEIGYGLMILAALGNLLLCWLLPPALPWNVMPHFVYTCGMSIVMPSVSLLLLDLFPATRGLVSSLQGFVQVALSGIVSGVVSPFLAHSVLALAVGMAGFLALSLVFGALYFLLERNPVHANS